MTLTEVKASRPNLEASYQLNETCVVINPLWFVAASKVVLDGGHQDSWSNGLTIVETVRARYIVKEKPTDIFDLIKQTLKEIYADDDDADKGTQ